MNYYFAWITMGRVSLVNIVRTKLRYLFGRDTQPPEVDGGMETLSRFAIKGATKMLQLFDDLARSGNMVRFSFTDFQACSIATTITLLAGVLLRDSTYESRVSFGVSCLRKMAIGNATAASGVKFIEALRSIANEATSRVNQISPPMSGSEPNPLDSSSARPGYREWGEWLSKTVPSLLSTDAQPGDGHIPLHPVAGTPRAESWALRPTNGDGWNYVEPPDGPSTTQMNQTYQTEMSDLAQVSLSDDLFSPYHDEQTFLLGLTGLDVLDFQ